MKYFNETLKGHKMINTTNLTFPSDKQKSLNPQTPQGSKLQCELFTTSEVYSPEALYEGVITPIFAKYPEIKEFASNQVAVTKEGSNDSNVNGWTIKLVQDGIISKPINGVKYLELERTLSSIVALKLILEGNINAYQELVALQHPDDKLSLASYTNLNKLATNAVSWFGYEAIEAMLIYGDLGKIKAFREKGLKYEIRAKDHDDWIEALLNQDSNVIEEIIPSFKNLTAQSQKTLREVAKLMHIHFGHVLHLEGGHKMFERFKAAIGKPSNITEETQALLELALVVQYCDVAGATSHVYGIRGFNSLTEKCYLGYQIVQKGLRSLMSGESEIEALNICTKERAKLLGINLDTPLKQVAVRLACQLRLYFAEDQPKLLEQSIENLDINSRKILIEQFSLDEGFNGWVRNPTYLPALLLNIYNNRQDPHCKLLTIEERMQNAVNTAVSLAKLFDYNKNEWQFLPDPINLNELAGLASKNPVLFLNPLKFNPADFVLDNLQQVVQQQE